MLQAPRHGHPSVLYLLPGIQLRAGWLDLLQRQLPPATERCLSQGQQLQGRSVQVYDGCCVAALFVEGLGALTQPLF